MNIAIIGRTHILLDSIPYLERMGHKTQLIVTAQEAPEYRSKKEDFEDYARNNDIAFLSTAKINTYKNHLSDLAIEKDIKIALSMNYVSTISNDIINIFPMGILNLHMGDLPRYRGNATPNWVIINKEKRVALCVHYMVGGELDSGDIIAKEYKAITMDTKVTELYAWMEERAPVLFADALSKLEADPSYILERQSKDPKDILRCYPRVPEDSKINWNMTNENILANINASSYPFQGAFTYYDNSKVIVWDAELYNDEENYCAIPGQITQISMDTGHVIVICGSGKLEIKEVQTDGYKGKPAEIIRSIRKRFT